MGITYGEKWQEIFNSIEHVCTNFNSLFNVDAIRHSISTLSLLYIRSPSIVAYSSEYRSRFTHYLRDPLSFSLSLSLLQTPLLMSPRRL
jgi:hypothetical protein